MKSKEKYYVYEWFNVESGYVFYVGKGCRRRWLTKRIRNAVFLDYINKNNCDSRIIKYFKDEEEALEFEKEHINKLKSQNMCHANLILGGIGSVDTKWTDDMRENMSKNNPMKIPSVAKKVGEKHRKPVVINGVRYESVNIASDKLGVLNTTIIRWCKQGHDSKGNPCRYLHEEQKKYDFKPKPNGIKVYVDNLLFNSIGEASVFLGVSGTAIRQAIKNKSKCKGHNITKYDNQHPSQVNSIKSNLEGSETNE